VSERNEFDNPAVHTYVKEKPGMAGQVKAEERMDTTKLINKWESYIEKMRTGSVKFVYPETKAAVQDMIELAERFVADLREPQDALGQPPREETLRAALVRIRAVACGEEQVDSWHGQYLLEGDTGGMQWIFRFAVETLTNTSAPATATPTPPIGWRNTWESTHCPYCRVPMAEVQDGIRHLLGTCVKAPASAQPDSVVGLVGMWQAEVDECCGGKEMLDTDCPSCRQQKRDIRGLESALATRQPAAPAFEGLRELSEKLHGILTSPVNNWFVDGKAVVHVSGKAPLIRDHAAHPQSLALIADALNFANRRLALNEFAVALRAELARKGPGA